MPHLFQAVSRLKAAAKPADTIYKCGSTRKVVLVV